MDSNSSWCNCNFPHLRSIHARDAREVLPQLVENVVENNGYVESDYLRPNVDAPAGRVVHISAMASVPSKFWRVRARYLFGAVGFIIGTMFSFAIQIGLAVLLTGP